MKPVDQLYPSANIGGRPLGDCWRACIATILEVPCKEVPHFVDEDDGTPEKAWYLRSIAFVEANTPYRLCQVIPALIGPQTYKVELTCETLGLPYREHELYRYGILTAQSPRGDWNHCVVVDIPTMEMVHDPHPSRAGVKKPWVALNIFATEPR